MQTHIFSSNQGYSNSLIKNNNYGEGHVLEKSSTEWNADYDGEKTRIDLKMDKNGKRKHVSVELTNDDLKELLNVPAVKKPLHIRLLDDFSLSKKKRSGTGIGIGIGTRISRRRGRGSKRSRRRK